MRGDGAAVLIRAESAGRPDPRLALLLVAVAAAVGVFAWRQNAQGGPGGPISLPKVLWLNYALSAWLVTAAWFWLRLRNRKLRLVYGVHLASWGVRGAAEVVLLYGLQAWIPPYGIAHDLLHIGLVTVALARLRPRPEGPGEVAARRFLNSLRIALLPEILFAAWFYGAVGGRTHGAEGLWFADHSERFAALNLVTALVVTVVYADLAAVLWKGRSLLFRRSAAG